MKKAPAVALTADIWKSGCRRYFVSLTAHLFDGKFETVPLVLSLRQLTERHLAVNVQAFILFELDDKFGVTPGQRVGITTDCGSEMVAATAGGVFGTRYSCIAHVWNNVVKNGLCLWSPPNPDKLVLFFYIGNSLKVRENFFHPRFLRKEDRKRNRDYHIVVIEKTIY